VSGADDAREPDFKEASARLNQGLKTCRAVLDNYRAMIIGEYVHPAAANDDEPPISVRP
jgi:hypothetical protein